MNDKGLERKFDMKKIYQSHQSIYNKQFYVQILSYLLLYDKVKDQNN